MTQLIIQTKTIHLHYLHQILILLNYFKHNNLEIRIQIFLPHNIRLKLPHITLLNKVLSITHVTNESQIHSTVQIQTTTPTRQPILQTLTYTAAQITQTQNIQTGLTVNTFHFNAKPDYTTFRNIYRPHLQTISPNPLSNSLTSTNPNSTQPSTRNNNQPNTLNPFSTSQSLNMTRNMLQNTPFQTYNPPSTTIRIYPHLNATYTQPFTDTSNTSSNVSNILTYNTVPASTIPQSTVSHPTYINSSTSISEPNEHFDGLDYN